jgi:hypothetical protein
MGPYCGHFQLHILTFLTLERLGNCLIQLAFVYHEDFHFKFQNWSGDVKVIRGHSGDYFLFERSHRSSQLCLQFEHIVQSHRNTSLFGPLLTTSLAIYHIV